MLDINVKTIDGQNRSYSVPDNYTVKQFKEKIANSLSIPVERQRLIFQGRELKDTNSLSEFDVNGKTLHLVQRVPPSVNQPQQQQQQQQTSQTNTNTNTNISGTGPGSPDVTQLIQNLLGGLGELGQNATFNTTTAGDGSNGMEVHIDLSNVSQLVNENEIRSRIRNIRRFLSLTQSRLNRLEEIQSGAPLDDTSNSSIIVGSIHGTASLSDSNGSIGTIGFDINHLPLNNLPAGILQQIPGLSSLSNNQLRQQSSQPQQQTSSTNNQQQQQQQQQPASHSTSTSTTTTSLNSASNQSNLFNIHNAAVQAATAAAAAQAANIHEAAVRAALASHQQTNETNNFSPVSSAANLAHHQAALNAAQTHANSISQILTNIQIPPPATSSTTTTSTTTTRNEDGTETTDRTTTTTSTNNENTQPQTESNRTQQQSGLPQQQEQQSIGVEVLGELIQSVMDSYSRFLPYLQHYHTMLVNDETEPPESPTASGSSSNLNVINNNNTNIIVLGGGDNRRQRFCNNINDMMHLLGHLFHNLSDLHINIRDRPPRQMHTMNSMQHSASTIISAAVPIEANIQIPFPPLSPSSTTNNSSQSERLAQFRQRHRSSQSLSGDSTTTSINTNPRIPTSASSTDPTANTSTTNISSSSSSTSDATEATDIPIPLPFSLNPPTQNQRSSSTETRSNQSGTTPIQPTSVPPPISGPRFFRPTLRAPGQPLPFSLPPLQYSTMNSYDQFLPCNSVHFYNTINPLQQSSTQPSSHPNQPISGDAGRWRLGAPNRPRARVPAAAFTRFAFNPEDTFNQANSTQRRRHPAGDQTSTTTTTTSSSSTTTQPSTNTTSTQPQMFPNIGGLNQIIGNILASGFQRQPTSENQHIRVNIGGIPGQISISTLGAETNQSTQDSTGPTVSSQTGQNLIENLLQGITGNLMTGSSQSSSSTTTPSAGTSTQMVNALMREAISLMDSNNTNDQRLNQPLRDFLRMFGEDDEDEESSIPNAATQNEMASRSTLGIFNTLFSSMTLGDMINLARGTDISHVFERSRLPLQTHIKNYFKNNKTPSEEFITNEENFNWLAKRLYNDVFIDANGLHIDLAKFKLSNENINFVKTFENLMLHHLKLMIRHVFDTKYDQPIMNSNETWSAVLFRNFQNLVQELVTLCRYCLHNADEQFTQIVTQKLRQAVMSQNIASNTMFYSIFENFVRSQIQNTLGGVHLSTAAIDHFVERKNDTSKAQTSSSLSHLNSEDAKSTDSCKSYETASSTLSGTYMDVDDSKENKITKQVDTEKLETQQSKSTLTSVTSNTKTSSSSSTWKNLVPNDWVPIIEKDLKTQENQQSTRPFSDAYCSGMPAKRRRILSSKNDLLSVNLFKKVLSRTLEKVQLKPNATHEQLIEDSIDDSQLIDSFNAEFNTALSDRLRADPDFNEIIKNDKKNNDKQTENKDENNEENERFCFSKKRLN